MKRLLIAVPLLALLASIGYAQAQKRPTAPKSGAPKPAATANKAATAKPAETPSAGLPTDATVDSFMRHMFGYDERIRWKILSIQQSDAPGIGEVQLAVSTPEGDQGMRFYVMPDQKWAMTGDLVPFGADPFAPVRERLARANGPVQGPPNAPITIVEFTDLQCPACKAAQPTIDRLLQELPNARFIFQGFPLNNIHPWSFKAATYADCVGRQNMPMLWKFVHLVFDHQEEITPENADFKLKLYANEAGANGSQIAACAAAPATEDRIRLSEALGLGLKVDATPTLFINGRRVANVATMPYEMLKAIALGTPK